MKILAIDPASVNTGYGILETADGIRRRLLEYGRLRAKAGAAVADRIEQLVADLSDLLVEADAGVILIELPLGKQYTRTEGKKSGMAVWALAAGALWQTCRQWSGRRNCDPTADHSCMVHAVDNTVWTRGKDKRARLLAVQAEFPAFQDASRSLDAADAVAMALWWLDAQYRLQMQRAAQQAG